MNNVIIKRYTFLHIYFIIVHLSLLCDLRSFQYTIAQIDGMCIRICGTHLSIVLPQSQYDTVVKSLLTSNDYVFSLAALELDEHCASHFVAIENENLSSYTSKAVHWGNPVERATDRGKYTINTWT